MHYRHIVIKLGTSSLTCGKSQLSRPQMEEYARQIAKLHQDGYQLVMTSSGAIAAGREAIAGLNLDSSLPSKQMLAAVGQVRLMEIWTQLFAQFGITVAQVLLTRGDFSHRQSYLNVRDTLLSLISHGIIPIINENDTVATHETRVGDNDNLSALVANMVAADLLILLTDQEGLYNKDPRQHADAQLIEKVDHIDSALWAVAKGASKLGTGGMVTKLEAAELATKSGTHTIIAQAVRPHVILDLVSGKAVGTFFKAKTTPLESRKRWLLSEKVQGTLIVDLGAQERIEKSGASLLPAGLIAVDGSFERGSLVQISTHDKKPFAVGLACYSHEEMQQLIKAHTSDIEKRLGYSYGPELVHRDDLALLHGGNR